MSGSTRDFGQLSTWRNQRKGRINIRLAKKFTQDFPCPLTQQEKRLQTLPRSEPGIALRALCMWSWLQSEESGED